jgi:hypothetical protein
MALTLDLVINVGDTNGDGAVSGASTTTNNEAVYRKRPVVTGYQDTGVDANDFAKTTAGSTIAAHNPP